MYKSMDRANDEIVKSLSLDVNIITPETMKSTTPTRIEQLRIKIQMEEEREGRVCAAPGGAASLCEYYWWLSRTPPHQKELSLFPERKVRQCEE